MIDVGFSSLMQRFDVPARNKVLLIPKGFAIALGEPSQPPYKRHFVCVRFRRGLSDRPLDPFGRSPSDESAPSWIFQRA